MVKVQLQMKININCVFSEHFQKQNKIVISALLDKVNIRTFLKIIKKLFKQKLWKYGHIASEFNTL